jgi:hypothetical protein
MPDRGDLEIYQGDDYAATVEVTNSLPPDQILLGYTAQAQIRQGVADTYPSVLIEMQATVSTPYVYLSVSNAQTVLLTRNAYWDLQIIDGSGVITTIMAGLVLVTQEVTRESGAAAAAGR